MDPSLRTAHKKTANGKVYTQLLLQRRSQATLAAGNVLAAVIWNAEGVILVDTMPHGYTITSCLFITVTQFQYKPGQAQMIPGG